MNENCQCAYNTCDVKDVCCVVFAHTEIMMLIFTFIRSNITLSCHAVVKMDAKLINCTKEEQRSVIRFLWAEGVPGAQIHLSAVCAQYGDKVLSLRIVYEWTEMFENGRTSVTDAERSGCPATATTTRNEERTLEMIRENRRITVEEVAGRLNVSVGSAYSLIHDSLKFSKDVPGGCLRN